MSAITTARPEASSATSRQVAYLTAPALVFLGVRAVGLVVLAWMAARNGRSITTALTSWDGHWYLGLAQGGYAAAGGDLVDAHFQHDQSNLLAFFPGYPALTSLIAHVPGVTLVDAAFAVTVMAGLACSYGLVRLGELLPGGSRRLGLVLAALFAASPMAVVLSMTYSEALFCAFAIWSLAFLLARRWVWAGVFCALSGLVRPTAAAVIVAVGIAAVIAIVRREDGWRPWVGALVAPVGLVGYLAWVGVRTGSWAGWFEVQQRGWGSQFDGGFATFKFALDALASGRSVLEVLTVGLCVAAIGLVVLCIRRRVPWPLIAYGIAVLVMDLGSNGLMNSKARLMLPAFVLLIPLGMALVRRLGSTQWLTLITIAVMSAWFGAYSITAWPYAI